MFRIQMLCCGKLTCTNTVVVTWPPLNILVNRPCSSWPTLMGRECKRRIIRRQTSNICELQFVLLSIYGNVHSSALGETDVCIKVGKYHQLAYPEILDLTVLQFLNVSNPTYQKIGCSRLSQIQCDTSKLHERVTKQHQQCIFILPCALSTPLYSLDSFSSH